MNGMGQTKVSVQGVRSLAGKGYRLSMRPRDWLIRRILPRLGSTSAMRIARVLDRLAERESGDQGQVIAGIEAERERMLATTATLTDGTLGQPGIYDADRTIRDACKASKPPVPSLLMHLLVREFEPLRVVELGTNLGISSAYQATALRANGPGHIWTFEASRYRLRAARELHERLGLHNVSYVQGMFQHSLPESLPGIAPIDFAFIDGHHQHQPTLEYTNAIIAHSGPQCVFVFDDIRWSDGMKLAWRDLKRDRRFELVIDLYGIGICLFTDRPTGRRLALPPLYHAFD